MRVDELGAEDSGWLADHLLAVSPIALVALEAESLAVVEASAAIERDLGYDPGELVGLTLPEILGATDAGATDAGATDAGAAGGGGAGSAMDVLEALEPLRAGRASEVTIGARARRRDGSTYPIEVSVSVAGLGAQRRLVALVADVSDRERAAAALRSSESRYNSLFYANHAVVVLSDPETGRIVDVNPAFCRMYGYDHDTVVRMNVADFNVRGWADIADEVGDAMAQRRNRFEFRHRLASGEIRDVEITSGPGVLDGRRVLYSIIHDITDRHLAEARAERLQRLLEGVVEIARAFGRLDDPAALAREACRGLVEIGGYRAAFIGGEPDADGSIHPLAFDGPVPFSEVFECRREDGDSGPDDDGVSRVRLAEGETDPVAAAISGRRTVLVNDVSELPEAWRATSVAAGTGSVAVVPIVAGGRLRGVGVVWAELPGAFGETETGLIERVLADLGLKFEAIERDQQRRAAESRFEILFEQSRSPIIISRGLVGLYVNPAFVELLGYRSAAEVLAVPLDSIVAPGARREAADRGRRRIRGLEPARPFELELIRSDGSLVPVRLEPAPIVLADGPAFALFVTDLTEEKASESALRASEVHYRTLIEQASDAIFVTDAQGRYVEVNDAACRMVGYERAELLAKTVAELGPLRTSDVRTLERIQPGGVLLEERRLVRHDGSRVEVELSARALADGRVHAIIRDISSRKAAERERDALAAAVAQASDAIIVTDATGRMVYVNPAFSTVFGYTADEALGRLPKDVLRSPGQPPETVGAIDAASAGGRSWSGRVRNRRADGATVEVDLAISPLRDSAGDLVGSVEVSRDVSREAALESQLRQAHKMEAIGRLAGGIAHDFNNQLTAIAGFAGLLASALPPDGPEAADLAEILRAADRAAALTGQLLAFSRKQVLRPRVLCLNEVVGGVTPMIERLIGEDVALAIEPDPELGFVLADPGQIEQVIVNLAVNARDAMAEGGALTIATSNVQLDPLEAERLGALPGPYVTLTAADTGCGMSREVLDHVFEPFFTTKDRGRGTGLGLSTVFGIVKQSNGYVAAESEPGHGATFRVYLPRFEGARTSDERSAPPVLTPRGAETILVVEDEEAVRTFARRVLERHGYRVLTADSGGQALDLVARHPARIDLVFTDIVMPGLSGLDVARDVVEMRPDIRVVCTSGYAETAPRRADAAGLGIPFVAKPYRAEELLARVRDVLDRAPERSTVWSEPAPTDA